MRDINLAEKQVIFGKIFYISKRLQIIGDKILAENMTIIQWLLIMTILQFGNLTPSINEVAELMGSSHQNIKQLALKLQKQGFLIIERDVEDLRKTKLILTDKCNLFCNKHEEKIKSLLKELFEDLTKEEIDIFYKGLNKLYGYVMDYEVRR